MSACPKPMTATPKASPYHHKLISMPITPLNPSHHQTIFKNLKNYTFPSLHVKTQSIHHTCQPMLLTAHIYHYKLVPSLTYLHLSLLLIFTFENLTFLSLKSCHNTNSQAKWFKTQKQMERTLNQTLWCISLTKISMRMTYNLKPP